MTGAAGACAFSGGSAPATSRPGPLLLPPALGPAPRRARSANCRAAGLLGRAGARQLPALPAHRADAKSVARAVTLALGAKV